MFSGTGKKKVLLPKESNKIMFAYTGKENVLLSNESNKIMFSDTVIWRAKRLKNSFLEREILLQRSRYFLWKGRYFFRDRDTSCGK